MKNKKIKMTEDQYHQAENDNYGICTKCGMINDGFHEPDARNYECDHCKEMSSFGISELLIMDEIEIVETEEESNYDERF